MKVSYDISVEGDPADGYDVLLDGKLLKHFNAKEYDNYDLASAITSDLEEAISAQLTLAKKSIDTLTVEMVANRDFDLVVEDYGIEYGDKIYDPFMRLEEGGVELGIRLDRKKGKVYVTMVNGVMLERDAELLT